MFFLKLCRLWALINPKIIIGTRGSKLALWQAEWVKSYLIQKYPDLSVELKIIKTKGDRILDVPLSKVGGKGLFVKEIEQALVDNHIDVAVHSMKDMPAELHDGLCIGAIPERENPCDVLISGKGLLLSQLPEGARVGTSSLRRIAQIKRIRPDLVITPLRGNLDTRIKKLEMGEIDAIILAAAGVKRLGLEKIITEYLNEDTMLPAVGQGALCIEIRKDDHDILGFINQMNHFVTRAVVLGERAFLKRIEGGCQVPIAGYGKVENDIFVIRGLVADLDGKTVITDTQKGPLESSESIGVALADRLIFMGAKRLLENLTMF
ncbi:MAG: hydroxymethylbilane synthase [Desulfobacterium sp.]|nr:hydroxymethylbilane synthase [Desulfobacterium sp.]MBU3950269.1 hydroxymethylbilane synthase [Pseudomonadota bacterium]MBU4010216.1 hydroxymethylbilane synthase [Pseudomonadota bacterium]MBU4035238.1 hydroxymethylbilane synthase [Pseudomonadota bacterium]